MSAAVSHEIRGPLEAIQNLQYLIQNTAGISPEVADLARSSSEEVSRVIAIAGSTLSFIRQSRKREPVDLGDAVASIQVLVAAMLRQKLIDFHIVTQGHCIVDAFAGETRQVLLNVIRNACEAVQRPGTTITVRIQGEESGVQVSIADEGSGIASEDMPRLFQFGFTTKGEKGNGMGLWTVKHIMQKHGGRVTVDSTPSQGTRFTLWWPRSISVQHAAAS